MKNKINKGFSLLELILALMVGTFILSSALGVYRLSQRDVEIRQTTDLVKEIFTTAELATMTRTDFKIGSGAGTNITMANLVTSKGNNPDDFVPGSHYVSNSFRHPFVGNVTLNVDNSVAGASDILRVNLTNIPRHACFGILSRMAGHTYDMRVNSNLVKLLPEPTAEAPGRNNIDVAQVSNLCNQRNNTIQLRKLKEINFAQLRHQGFTYKLTADEEAFLQPLYSRTQNALQARESAQLAIP